MRGRGSLTLKIVLNIMSNDKIEDYIESKSSPLLKLMLLFVIFPESIMDRWITFLIPQFY